MLGNSVQIFTRQLFLGPANPGLPTRASFGKLVPAFPGFSGLLLPLPNGLAICEGDLAKPMSHIVP